MTHKIFTKELLNEYSAQHPLGGKYLRITDGQTSISIVGGRKGLYGDFVSTFELAIIDETNKNFVTKELLRTSEDVCGYMNFEEIVEIVDKIYKSGFQFVRG